MTVIVVVVVEEEDSIIDWTQAKSRPPTGNGPHGTCDHPFKLGDISSTSELRDILLGEELRDPNNS